MNRTVLAAIVTAVLGLLLVLGGTAMLLMTRVTPRSAEGAKPARVAPTLAAGVAILGVLLTALGASGFTWWLATSRLSQAATGPTGRIPLSEAATAAAAVGVVIFTIFGSGIALVADRNERRRMRRFGAGPADGGGLALTAGTTDDRKWPETTDATDEAGPDGPGPRAPHPARDGEDWGAANHTGRSEPLDVEPGYIYADDEGRWYLAVGDGEYRSRLVELPGFALADGPGRNQPTNLHRSGAAELTVATDQDAGDVGDDPAVHSASDRSQHLDEPRPAPSR
jgi:hypothetical protein